jgi:hypothetical protein
MISYWRRAVTERVRGNLMEQLAPRQQMLKRHDANSLAPLPGNTMTLRIDVGGSSPDYLSCRCASAR